MNAVNSTLSVEQTRRKIGELLDSLSYENLVVVQRFLEFLRQQAQQDEPAVVVKDENAPYLYPTIPVPLSVFGRLIDAMPPVGGDALADTEALYDEV